MSDVRAAAANSVPWSCGALVKGSYTPFFPDNLPNFNAGQNKQAIHRGGLTLIKKNSLNMADNKEEVTSTTASGKFDFHELDFNGVDDANEAAAKESFDVDDIVDLVGGAQDAIYRHIAEDSALKEDPEPELYRPASEPEAAPEAQTFSGLVDVSVPPPVVSESEPAAAPHSTTTTVTEEPTPLSDTLVVPPSYEPVVEPESTQIVPPAEPQVAPPPRPVTPELTLPTPAAPPAAAAAAAPPIREEEAPVAPASCKRFHIKQTVIE